MAFPYHLILPQKTYFLGKNIYYIDETTSTNEEAKRVAKEGAPHGSIVFANYQYSGKGRLGRSWVAEKGKNICMSILLKPGSGMLELAPLVSLASGLACANVLIALGFEAGIKWPNDILISGKKVCGILVETCMAGNQITDLVMGMGVNVNSDIENFPVDLREKVTSLSIQNNSALDIEDLAGRLILELDRTYDILFRKDTDIIIKMYKKLCLNLNKKTKALVGNAVYEGTTVDITPDGHLLLRLENGDIKEIFSGEASVRALDGSYI